MIGGHVKVGFNPIPVSRGALDGKLIRALAATVTEALQHLPRSADDCRNPACPASTPC